MADRCNVHSFNLLGTNGPLHGMIEAIERQEQEEVARELSRLDRLALLIDQQ
jgi:hypothetical protein